ncbi:MAG: hypothetical protein JWM80_2467 [Cyanobacteria bacterium RYN_339]|nr:hypothetical protein [Cyanobacteria bacterium RYN_339]
MPDIGIVQILDKLAERLEPAKAEELLALALEQLGLPVQDTYTPAQVMSIGAAIADAQRATLANSNIPQAQELEKVVGPFIDGIKKDAPHQH